MLGVLRRCQHCSSCAVPLLRGHVAAARLLVHAARFCTVVMILPAMLTAAVQTVRRSVGAQQLHKKVGPECIRGLKITIVPNWRRAGGPQLLKTLLVSSVLTQILFL